MNDSYIRNTVFANHLKWTKEQRELLEKTESAETFEEKDELYRKAAVLGIRLDSVGQVIRDLDKPDCSQAARTRAFQRHMRDMARLKYRPRPVGVISDATDQEVISQFYKDGVVINKPKGFTALSTKA